MKVSLLILSSAFFLQLGSRVILANVRMELFRCNGCTAVCKQYNTDRTIEIPFRKRILSLPVPLSASASFLIKAILLISVAYNYELRPYENVHVHEEIIRAWLSSPYALTV
jgi:hypothetical protein